MNTILDNGESWFYDLILDIVVLPDGKRFLLDEDELSEALRDNIITRKQYDEENSIEKSTNIS
jgi:predicted RNA-binding protein associated with RNAse of E/G family